MYRHSAQLSIAKNFLPSPAPDELTDLDADILEELAKKRRQLDDDIAKFNAQKEKEFRDFEKDLRFKYRRSRSPSTKDIPAKPTTPANHSVLSLLAAGSKFLPNGKTQTAKKSSDGVISPKTKPIAPSAKPTLSIDKLTINGTTTPPVSGTSPSQATALTSSLSRSPSNAPMALTPPRFRPPLRSTPIPSTQDRNDSFAGLFVPAYLPLLEARPNSQQTQQQQTQPQQHTAQSSSLPHEIPTLLNSANGKRALTAPILPSTSLPSALRTASGTNMRKRKHVTFRLADSAVVEPSSSYEETSSPEILSDGSGAAEPNKMNEILAGMAGGGDSDELDQHHPMVEGVPNHSTATDGVGPPSRPSPPRFRSRENSIDSTDSRTGSGSAAFGGAGLGDIPEAADGGSGVGFFELDEELGSESPSTSHATKAGQGGGVVERDPFDDEEETEAAESDGDVTLEQKEEEVAAEAKKEQRGRRIRKKRTGGRDDGNGNSDLKYDTFSAGSVPIDIVRPSGSWVGSFGH